MMINVCDISIDADDLEWKKLRHGKCSDGNERVKTKNEKQKIFSDG